MPSFRIESIHVHPVCIDIVTQAQAQTWIQTTQGGSAPFPHVRPPQRTNPFAGRSKLATAMLSEFSLERLNQDVDREINALSLEQAIPIGLTRCGQLMSAQRTQNVPSDPRSVVLLDDSTGYVPVGGGRHEVNSWVLLSPTGPAGSSKSAGSADEAWSFPLMLNQQDCVAYVCFRMVIALLIQVQ